MRPRISIRGSDRPSVRMSVHYAFSKTTRNEVLIIVSLSYHGRPATTTGPLHCTATASSSSASNDADNDNAYDDDEFNINDVADDNDTDSNVRDDADNSISDDDADNSISDDDVDNINDANRNNADDCA